MSGEVEIERRGSRIAVEIDGGTISTQSVEAHLLYAILQELRSVNGNLIDVENAVYKAAR